MTPAIVALFLLVAPVASSQAAEAIALPKTPSSSAANNVFTMDDNRCGGEGHYEDMRCLSRYLRWLDTQLNEAYTLALRRLPERDESDTRKGREQLRKAQRAWLKYKDENCALIGGMEGGSNAWVTDYAMMCMERETKERIRFLQRLARDE